MGEKEPSVKRLPGQAPRPHARFSSGRTIRAKSSMFCAQLLHVRLDLARDVVGVAHEGQALLLRQVKLELVERDLLGGADHRGRAGGDCLMSFIEPRW